MNTLRKGDVVTPKRLAAQGVSRSRLRVLVREGHLTPMSRGVYADASRLRAANDAASDGDPTLLHAFHVAAALLSPPTVMSAAASHQSAATLHRLDLLNPPTSKIVTLTRPPGAHGRRTNTEWIRIHVAAVAGDVEKRCGLPVTTATRTIVDLAREVPFIDGVVAADSGLHSGAVTEADLADKLAACARWPGIERARRVVAFADRRSESPLETCARVKFAEHGLPPPDLQVDIRHEGRFIARVDFMWHEFRTVAEADGLAKYHSRREALAQLERDKNIRAARYKMVHFTHRQLFWETWRVIGWLRDAFTQPGSF